MTRPLASCPVCRTKDPVAVFSLGDVPVVCNQLWPDERSARAAPTGTVDLVRCPNCTMLWNAAFDADRMSYAPGYENALHFSPKFQAFAEELVRGLVARFDLRGRDVVEIGCGDGHILDLFVKHGARSATGFDPSMLGKTSEFTGREGVRIEPEYFRPGQLDRPFDAVICRHVLEHLDAPMTLLSDIRCAIGDRDVPVYFEVPNAGWMLKSLSMWDVIYEHVGYWTAPSISAAFRRAGFQPTSLTTGYDGQFLLLEARPSRAPRSEERPEEIVQAAAEFAAAVEAELTKWRERLSGVRGKAVVWGAGSKGITFANVVTSSDASLAAFIDINPRKTGLFAPGVGLPVLDPTALIELQPELVLVSNALYENEIGERVRAAQPGAVIDVIAG